MDYNEIMQISDLNEKNEKLKEFYQDIINVNDWLLNDVKQKIKFKDRIEYKQNGVYHRLNGPAIEYFKGNGDFYLYGEQMEETEWKKKSTLILREKKLNRVV